MSRGCGAKLFRYRHFFACRRYGVVLTLEPMEKRKIGRALALARQRAGWTQAELGSRAGLSQSWVNHFERDRRAPSLDSFLALAKALADYGRRPLGEVFRELTEEVAP